MKNKISSDLQKLFNLLANMAADGLVVAFSGGVDSSLVLAAACRARKKESPPIRAVFIQSFLYPEQEYEEAKRLAEGWGALFTGIIFTEEDLADLSDNPPDRCYRCKYRLFERLAGCCQNWGYRFLADGTNGDDQPADRPGMKALAKLRVRSPLRELGFTKKTVRRLARELELAVSQKPASPCLATRLPFGSRLEPALLSRLAAGEKQLQQLGFRQVRLRLHGQIIRIEVEPTDFNLLLDKKEQVVEVLKDLGFLYITLDLEGFRSGSMDLTKPDQT